LFRTASGTERAQQGSVLNLLAAFADINIQKSRSVYYWLGVSKVSVEKGRDPNSNFFLSIFVRRLYQVLRKWQP